MPSDDWITFRQISIVISSVSHIIQSHIDDCANYGKVCGKNCALRRIENSTVYSFKITFNM